MRGEKYRILQLIMQGKIEGKRSVGRSRNSWLKNLREWFGCNNNELFRAAVSKISPLVQHLRITALFGSSKLNDVTPASRTLQQSLVVSCYHHENNSN